MITIDEALRRAENAMVYKEDLARENLEAALASLAADGWVLVPKEPSDARMVQAWRNHKRGTTWITRYRAMLAAAPKVKP